MAVDMTQGIWEAEGTTWWALWLEFKESEATGMRWSSRSQGQSVQSPLVQHLPNFQL